MRTLLACTCLTPIALLAATTPLRAETVVDTARTTAAATSTIKSGAADDIRITSAGSVKPAGGTAVTIDSNNSVKNEGTIQITGANDATGILANANVSGGITNSGTITIDENYTATDTDNDGDLDGPFAQGSNRFGIRTAGAFTGNVANSGTITVEGNDSAGIALGGPLTGSLSHTGGTIAVTGDRSYGIRTGNVSGDVKIQSAVSARGANAVGVAIDGNVGGALVIQGAISSSGYRSTSAPSDVSKLDADDLLQGGPALRVSGNVGGGIVFAVPPADNNKDDADEDKDGIPDANEGTAAVISYGAAPAVQIGSDSAATTIGAVGGNADGHGIVVNGTITGAGVYKDVAANGLVIGGLGGNVTVAGGVTVTGTVSASSNSANATALRIGSGASVPNIKTSGVITAAGGNAAGSLVRAVAIDAGGDVRSLANTGRIQADAAGDGTAVAISDKAGKLALVETSGSIIATGKSGNAIAIDLSANNAGATVKQVAVASGATAPVISGDILFGAGADTLDIADGTVTGAAKFGAGDNRLSLSGDAKYTGNATFGAGVDTIALSGTSTMTGALDFGGGADSLTLGGTSIFTGTLLNSTGAAVNVSGGKLLVQGTNAVAVSSLAVSGQGTIGVNIDAQANKFTQYLVSGAANFAAGSKVAVSLANVSDAEGEYLIVKSGSMTGGANLASEAAALPFMFKSNVTANDAAGEVKLNVARKTTAELGLNRSQASAYDAIFKVLDSDAKVANVFLGYANGDDFRRAVASMLPDHAGGAFETVTQGSRATARYLADPNAPMSDQGGWGFWLQQVAWGTSKGIGKTSSYDITGWGASGGLEIKTGGFGNVGLSIAYLSGKDSDGDVSNEVTADQIELAAHWRGQWGGLNAFARVSAAQIDFDGVRVFSGRLGTETVSRTASGAWNGKLYSASGGLSYELRFGRFSLRPAAAIDYYKLDEKGYTETGGGDAFNLTVLGRKSDELAATGSVAAGLNFGSREPDATWLRLELEGGRRQIVGGALGATIAQFKGGERFTLEPEQRTDGWVGKFRAVGGLGDFQLGGEASAEEQQGRVALAFRVSLSLGL
ncbi:autotransporter outer membrane beta-barrel domain-containing protein [Sphingomonas colocasiae]|uniref:Autotransporter domain-containing protein n=1 Tax=Sphingomonas colocasiae TaxID=1848973 RepID=A0ABS7PRI6_9SPHN|nr:autotransporter domain-containing protein [Sphingomonas colocasiae]MBY8823958.1 autotransporter domain-containing protein [Sphingomonas colocasiae]